MLEKGETADERLIDLKRKMGLLPPAEPAETGRLSGAEAAAKQLSDGSAASVQEAELLEEFEELEKGETGAG
jgi:hypothetical protein